MGYVLQSIKVVNAVLLGQWADWNGRATERNRNDISRRHILPAASILRENKWKNLDNVINGYLAVKHPP
ncbi:MAG: hypothetical protein EA342_03990 [Leptolyngbya sp. LCM1.Bin17]|nr:MAG: hypothetical protein EA342_03990 [Leptolyngbya sp. LCM1.Bin17]